MGRTTWEISMMGQTRSTLLTTLLTSFIKNQRNRLTHPNILHICSLKVARIVKLSLLPNIYICGQLKWPKSEDQLPKQPILTSSRLLLHRHASWWTLIRLHVAFPTSRRSTSHCIFLETDELEKNNQSLLFLGGWKSQQKKKHVKQKLRFPLLMKLYWMS